jgi:hypothetical protein
LRDAREAHFLMGTGTDVQYWIASLSQVVAQFQDAKCFDFWAFANSRKTLFSLVEATAKFRAATQQ